MSLLGTPASCLSQRSHPHSVHKTHFPPIISHQECQPHQLAEGIIGIENINNAEMPEATLAAATSQDSFEHFEGKIVKFGLALFILLRALKAPDCALKTMA